MSIVVKDPSPINVSADAQDVTVAASVRTGTRGPQGLPGTGAAAADSAVAGYISTTGTSATRTALDALYRPPLGDGIAYVSKLGSNSNSGEAPSAAKATITAALATLPGGAGTVMIGAGTFNESLISPETGARLVGRGRRSTVINCTSLTNSAIRVIGTSPLPKHQVEVHDLWITGPGQASGGTGVGLDLQWLVTLCLIRNVNITGFGSHGIRQSEAYQVKFDNVLSANNGGDGYYGLNNINQCVWDHCQFGINTGRGLAVDGGAAGLIINCDMESNGGAGIDLRSTFAYTVQSNELEVNGNNGVSPNIHIGGRSAGEPAVATTIAGNIIQGQSVTKTGLNLAEATRTDYRGNWFSNHVTVHASISASASRTMVGPNTFAGAAPELTDASFSTAVLDYDATNLIARTTGLRFAPRATDPVIAAQGNLWWQSSTDRLKARNASAIVTLYYGFDATVALDFPSIAANADASLTVTLTGAVFGMPIVLGPPGDIGSGLTWTGYVSAANTVTVRLRNHTGAAIDPPANTWRVLALKV